MAIVIPQAISDNGWIEHDRCTCGNVRKIKFRHPQRPGLELEWWVSWYQFKIMNGNTTKQPLTHIGKAQQILTAL